MKQIKLSPSTLNLFLSCPRCFWLRLNRGIDLPSGAMPTITNGLDRTIKEYMNRYRPHGKIPPFLEGKISGKLIEFSPKSLSVNISGNILTGRLDECIVLGDGHHAPLDHKSKGFAPKENHEVHAAYQLQMDCYTLLLQHNGHNVNGIGYIAYYYPTFGELHAGIPFNVHICKLKTNPQRALEVFNNAIRCLQDNEPKSGENCELCRYVRERRDD
jgi:CRISPR/Cas system-associated exonuclease Cas4 (RecB family)